MIKRRDLKTAVVSSGFHFALLPSFLTDVNNTSVKLRAARGNVGDCVTNGIMGHRGSDALPLIGRAALPRRPIFRHARSARDEKRLSQWLMYV